MSTPTETTVELTINGKLVSAAKGDTVLQAARKAGIEIPALCEVALLDLGQEGRDVDVRGTGV